MGDNNGCTACATTRKQRIELATSAGLAVADYRLSGYTKVPIPLRGRGAGYRLVAGALDDVRRLNLKVAPECRFVRQVIDRNPEYQDLL